MGSPVCIARPPSRVVSQVVGGMASGTRTRWMRPGGVMRRMCVMALWLKVSGAVDHMWEGLGGLGGFDATCGYPGEGPLGMGVHGCVEETKGKKNRMREARAGHHQCHVVQVLYG